MSDQEILSPPGEEECLSPPGENECYVEDKSCQTESKVQDMEVEVVTIDEVQEVTSGISNLKTAEVTVSHEPNYIVISPFCMPENILDSKETGINWIATPRISIDSVTNKILSELKERDPKKAKYMTVAAYQQYIATHDTATIESHLTKIMRAAADSKIHKICLATFFHTPEEEKLWDRVCTLNQHLRLLNLDLGLPPNNVHKSLTFSFNKGIVCYTRYDVWTERMNETGLGNTLNHEGLNRYKNYIVKYIRDGGFNYNGPPVKAIGGDTPPAPLCFTRGYKGNPKMMKFIEEKGLRMPAKPVGDARTGLQAKIDKARSVARKFAAENNLKYGRDFDETEGESNKEKQEDKESTIRGGKSKLEERDRLRKENKEHQLKVEVHKLKLEGLRARTRSRSKYEEFEREIGALKERLKHKDRLVAELRKDLARSEVDCEEWREYAERGNAYHRGPKRARRH